MKTISFIFTIYFISWLFSFISASEFYVRNLPGIPLDYDFKLHSGHITIQDKYGSSFFFMFAPNKYIIDSQKTLIWLNGGPGCSSMEGFFLENGPILMTKTGAFKENQGSWNEFANFIAVDQPVGTGYSYSTAKTGPKGLAATAEAFLSFLDAFFEKFPEYRYDDLYISGESYAGQYIPYIANAILKRNKEEPTKFYKLKGLLIGNGWISPSVQYASYLTFAMNNKLVTEGSVQHRILLESYETCQKALKVEDKDNYPVCSKVIETIALPSLTDDKKCVNLYDYRIKTPTCDVPWPVGSDVLRTYLNQAPVLKALNIDSSKNIKWEECSEKVYNRFQSFPSSPSVHLLPEILKEIPVLLYSGDKDVICNHIGTELMIESLEWNGRKGFTLADGSAAPVYNWIFMDQIVGTYQFARNLTYVLINDASHMVPYDKPLESQDMLNRFLELDPDVILQVRKLNAKLKKFSLPIIPGGTLEEIAKLRKEKTTWIIYYHILAFILLLILVGVAYCAWRCFKKSKKSNPPITEKYNNISNPTYIEDGIPYESKEYSVYQPRTDYNLYDPSIVIPYSEHQPYSDTKNPDDPMPGYSHSRT